VVDAPWVRVGRGGGMQLFSSATTSLSLSSEARIFCGAVEVLRERRVRHEAPVLTVCQHARCPLQAHARAGASSSMHKLLRSSRVFRIVHTWWYWSGILNSARHLLAMSSAACTMHQQLTIGQSRAWRTKRVKLNSLNEMMPFVHMLWHVSRCHCVAAAEGERA
jgi:hypothetical protein